MEKLNPFKLLFNRFYHFFFIERFFKSLEFNFPKNIYRWDLIQYIIDKYKFTIPLTFETFPIFQIFKLKNQNNNLDLDNKRLNELKFVFQSNIKIRNNQ